MIGKTSTSRENVQRDLPNATPININNDDNSHKKIISPTHENFIINTPNNDPPHMNFPQVFSRNVTNARMGANNRVNWLTELRIMWNRVRSILSRDTRHSRLPKSTNPRRERYLEKKNEKFIDSND